MFIELRAAFDRVGRSKLRNYLGEKGISKALVE